MLNAARIWILLSTWLVGAGWILSALHQLNRTGYGAAFALTGMAAIFLRRKIKWPSAKNLPSAWHKFRRRFKHPAPLLFLILASMSFVSGVLYPPYNSDTDAYRLPRVLHWLGQEQWHWIHTADARMNVADCGYEWFVAPMVLFTRARIKFSVFDQLDSLFAAAGAGLLRLEISGCAVAGCLVVGVAAVFRLVLCDAIGFRVKRFICGRLCDCGRGARYESPRDVCQPDFWLSLLAVSRC